VDCRSIAGRVKVHHCATTSTSSWPYYQQSICTVPVRRAWFPWCTLTNRSAHLHAAVVAVSLDLINGCFPAWNGAATFLRAERQVLLTEHDYGGHHHHEHQRRSQCSETRSHCVVVTLLPDKNVPRGRWAGTGRRTGLKVSLRGVSVWPAHHQRGVTEPHTLHSTDTAS